MTKITRVAWIKFLIIIPSLVWPVFFLVIWWGGMPGSIYSATIWAMAFGILQWWLFWIAREAVDEHIGNSSTRLRPSRRTHG